MSTPAEGTVVTTLAAGGCKVNLGVLLTTGALKRKLGVESRHRVGHVKLQCFVFSYIYNVTYHTDFLTFLGNLINKKVPRAGLEPTSSTALKS